MLPRLHRLLNCRMQRSHIAKDDLQPTIEGFTPVVLPSSSNQHDAFVNVVPEEARTGVVFA